MLSRPRHSEQRQHAKVNETETLCTYICALVMSENSISNDMSCVCVCMYVCSAVGTELLKNLVLPGTGAFTLVDTATVTLTDCGNNFFVSEDRVGEVSIDAMSVWW